MKHLLLFVIVFAALVTCSKNLGGTGDDVHSGTICGKLIAEDETTITDTVTVTLYKKESSDGLHKRYLDNDTFPRTCISTDGYYEFKMLAKGSYSAVVARDSILIGSENNITLESDEDSINVDITVLLVINQTFNIWNDESQNITINNFYITNGTIIKSDSGYLLTTAETDTLTFEAEIEQGNGDTSTVTIRIIWKDDGSVLFEIIEGDEDDELIITPDPVPPKGHLDAIDIDLSEPGVTEVESTFDTSDVPEKSR